MAESNFVINDLQKQSQTSLWEKKRTIQLHHIHYQVFLVVSYLFPAENKELWWNNEHCQPLCQHMTNTNKF